MVDQLDVFITENGPSSLLSLKLYQSFWVSSSDFTIGAGNYGYSWNTLALLALQANIIILLDCVLWYSAIIFVTKKVNGLYWDIRWCNVSHPPLTMWCIKSSFLFHPFCTNKLHIIIWWSTDEFDCWLNIICIKKSVPTRVW